MLSTIQHLSPQYQIRNSNSFLSTTQLINYPSQFSQFPNPKRSEEPKFQNINDSRSPILSTFTFLSPPIRPLNVTFAPMNSDSKKNIRTLTLEDITLYLENIGEKKFRAKQVYEWLWQKHAHSFEAMTNLSKELRLKLSEEFGLPALTIDATQYSADGTIKSRFKTFDGHLVEGVLIPTEKRQTACVSSRSAAASAAAFAQRGTWKKKETFNLMRSMIKWF